MAGIVQEDVIERGIAHIKARNFPGSSKDRLKGDLGDPPLGEPQLERELVAAERIVPRRRVGWRLQRAAVTRAAIVIQDELLVQLRKAHAKSSCASRSAVQSGSISA